MRTGLTRLACLTVVCVSVVWVGLSPAVYAQQGEAKSPLKICATSPDLGDIATQIGGSAVAVTVFAKGQQDLHHLDPKPSFVTALAGADALIVNGMDLEIGWIPPVIDQSRNPNVQPGAKGYLDASMAISKKLGVPVGGVNRAMGDVHAAGNPHYLLDPLNAVAVAKWLCTALTTLRVTDKAVFERGRDAFVRRIAQACVGPTLAAKYEIEKLGLVYSAGKLRDFLRRTNQEADFKGWFADLEAFAGQKVVAEHDEWAYLCNRFGIKVAGLLEPKPGLPPTTEHMTRIVELMKAEGIKVILSLPYFDPAHARFVAEKSGGTVVVLAHQLGAVEGATDYVAHIGQNVKRLADALKASADAAKGGQQSR